MDRQHEELIRFGSMLRHINTEINAAYVELAQAHVRVDADWQDAFRRSYDSVYVPLAEKVTRYVRHEGPAYEKFIEEKKRALERYRFGL